MHRWGMQLCNNTNPKLGVTGGWMGGWKGLATRPTTSCNTSGHKPISSKICHQKLFILELSWNHLFVPAQHRLATHLFRLASLSASPFLKLLHEKLLDQLTFFHSKNLIFATQKNGSKLGYSSQKSPKQTLTFFHSLLKEKKPQSRPKAKI
jgi:hypothetical protein